MASSWTLSRKMLHTCMYKDCSNSRQHGHHLYVFPKNDNPLFAQWIARVGNPNIKYYAASTLRRLGICGEHFSPEMFKSATKTRPRLIKGAVPKPWADQEECREEEELHQDIAGYHVEEEEPQIIEGCNVEEERIVAIEGYTAEEERVEAIEGYTAEEERIVAIEGYTAEEERVEAIEGYTAEEERVEAIEGYTAEEERVEVIEGYTAEEERVEVIEGYTAEQENGHERGTEDIVMPQEDYIHVPTRVYASTSLYFSENEDDRMEWVAIEPPASYPTRRTRTQENSNAGYTAEEERVEVIEGSTAEEEEVQIVEGYTAEEERVEVIEGSTAKEEEVQIVEGCTAEQETARTPLYLSENEDDRMESVANEPPTSYPTRRTRTQENSNATRLKNINRALRREIIDLKLALKCHKQKLQRAMAAKVRVSKAAETVDEFLDRQKCLNKVSRTMVKLQLKKHNAPYTTEEQDLARMIFYHSPSAYNRLRKSGCHLPAESTVRKWIAINNLDTGFEDHVFDNIKRRLSEFPLEQRLCALKWDEMSIKTWEEYSASLDQVEGLVDLGMLGRRDEKARYVFVFCVDSINGHNKWRQPLAYFLSGKGGLKAADLKQLLYSCLRRLKESGAHVKILTCDQCTTNQKVYRELEVTEDHPYFHYEGTTYYAAFDFPHLIKRLVAQLRKHGNIYVANESIISFSDMDETWNYDRAMNSSRLLPHITEIHLHPNAFQSMNVKRAFQMFGRKFAAAIEVAGDDPKGLKGRSTTWEKTVEFIRRMDKLIDYCNCYNLNSNCNKKKPICNRHDVVYQTIQDAIEWTKKWSICPYGQDAHLMKRPPCIKGMTQTFGAFSQVYDSITDEEITRDFQFAIGLANQDSVEHLFSKLRQRGGFNFNPTVRMVRLTLRHIMYSKLIKIGDRTNTREEDEETAALIGDEAYIPAQCNFTPSENLPVDEEDDGALECATHLYDNSTEAATSTEKNNGPSFYEETSITYFAGYIVHHIMRKYGCTECRNAMLKTPLDVMEPAEKYIATREYSDDDDDEYAPDVRKLQRPTEAFVKIITTQLQLFQKYWRKFWHQKHVLKQLCTTAIQRSKIEDPAWFTEDNSCYEHRVEALKHLYKVKLHDQARKRNEEEKSLHRPTKSQKLKNILHE